MPTGYTANIKPQGGCTFEQFVMDCARAFGACIMLRDEPGGGERIPEKFEPSDYHARAVATARAELSRLEAMKPDEVMAECERDRCVALGRAIRAREDNATQRDAYNAMLMRVRAWTPPTSEHEGLKSFMVEQITNSIEFDCSYAPPTPEAIGAITWWSQKIAAAKKEVTYHEAEHQKEAQRADERTKWVSALRASLAKVSP